MQEIVKFFSFLINVFRQLLTLHDSFRRFMTLFFPLFLFLVLCIIFFSIIFLFHSHNFFLRSFCHIKNNASTTFSKSKKCNASFFSPALYRYFFPANEISSPSSSFFFVSPINGTPFTVVPFREFRSSR